jgi:hypothetical protein
LVGAETPLFSRSPERGDQQRHERNNRQAAMSEDQQNR